MIKGYSEGAGGHKFRAAPQPTAVEWVKKEALDLFRLVSLVVGLASDRNPRWRPVRAWGVIFCQSLESTNSAVGPPAML